MSLPLNKSRQVADIFLTLCYYNRMKKILLITNAFYRTERLEKQYAMLEKALEERGFAVERVLNAQLIYALTKDGADFFRNLPETALMWDKDVPLAKALELAGVRVFNSSRAIALCDDKVMTHLALTKAGVPAPTTFIVPMSYTNVGYDDLSFADEIIKRTGLPVVFKQAKSSYGMGVRLAESVAQAKSFIRETKEDMLLQEYVKESHGRDLRVNVVGGKAVCAVQRSSDGFCSNVLQGGRMTAAELTDDAAKLAVAAANAVGADFAGVDLLFKDGGYTVCEVNTSAHFGTVKEVTGINLADAIAEHIDLSV